MSTIVQFEGELYILATDQGFINQPDLVWEKFNEVRCLFIYLPWITSPFFLGTYCLLCLIVSNSIKFGINTILLPSPLLYLAFACLAASYKEGQTV